jgi:transcriptional regulator with XRE-family HTH domain
MPYRVRVRNTPDGERNSDPGTWATYARLARENAVPPISQSELARRLDTDRTTIWRWEHGKQKPEDPAIVVRFAAVLGLDPDEALAAAGLRPGVAAPSTPTMEVDEEIELVRTDQRLDADMKRRIIALILERREQDRQRRMEETRQMIDLMRRAD